MAIVKQSTGNKYPTLICLRGGLPVKIFQSLAKDEGLGVQEVLSLGSLSEHYAVKSHDISFGKTLEGLCHHEAGGILPTSLLLFPKVGILSGGKFSTPKISVFLKTESVSLSSVLEMDIPKKYFLSETILKTLMRQNGTFQAMKPRDWGGVAATLTARMAKMGRGDNYIQYKGPYNRTIPKDQEVTTALRTNHTNGNPQIMVQNKGASQHYRVYGKDGLAPTLQSQSGMSSQKHPFVMEMKIVNCVTPDAYLTRGERNRDENGKAVLTSMHDRRVRKLMPIECERLMSWPDNHTKYGIDDKGNKVEISDSQRYKMCGNGVVSNVIKAIINNLYA